MKSVQLDDLTHMQLQTLADQMSQEKNMRVTLQDAVRFAIWDGLKIRMNPKKCAPGQCDFSNSLECPKCGNLLF